jgi:hypothetical protein
MAKTAQILSNLNENLFDFFDFAVKKFRGSSLAPPAGLNALRAGIPDAGFTPIICVNSCNLRLYPHSVCVGEGGGGADAMR